MFCCFSRALKQRSPHDNTYRMRHSKKKTEEKSLLRLIHTNDSAPFLIHRNMHHDPRSLSILSMTLKKMLPLKVKVHTFFAIHLFIYLCVDTYVHVSLSLFVCVNRSVHWLENENDGDTDDINDGGGSNDGTKRDLSVLSTFSTIVISR